VASDSGVATRPAAAGATVQALFGPTDPACWAPGGKVQILRHCSRQATEHGQVRVCGNPTCMEGIEVAHVLESAMSTLSNVQNPVQNRPFSVDNFVDLPSIKSVRAIHHHFDTLSSEDRSRE